MHIENMKRANRAVTAIKAMLAETGGEADETNITDLLTDLMHLSEQAGENFDDHLRIAQGHYRSERADP